MSKNYELNWLRSHLITYPIQVLEPPLRQRELPEQLPVHSCHPGKQAPPLVGRGRRPSEAQAGQPRGSLSGSEATGQSRGCLRPKVAAYGQPILSFNILKLVSQMTLNLYDRLLNFWIISFIGGPREPWLTVDAKEHRAKGYYWARVPSEKNLGLNWTNKNIFPGPDQLDSEFWGQVPEQWDSLSAGGSLQCWKRPRYDEAVKLTNINSLVSS